ncbi:putative endonuclease [Trichinella spiralis]|uniref:Endonuclease n=1 Tax=Trichinella spiralis TaxID=6334 RepID=A0ABR3KD09_TRISP
MSGKKGPDHLRRLYWRPFHEEPKIDGITTHKDSSSTLDTKVTEECQTKRNFVRKLSYGNIKGDTTDSYDNSEKNTKIDLLHLVQKFQSRNPVLFKAENDMKTMKQIRIKQIALATAHFKQATEDLSFSSEKEPESREKLKLDNEEIMTHFTDLKNLISAFSTEHRNYDMSQKLGLVVDDASLADLFDSNEATVTPEAILAKYLGEKQIFRKFH